MIQHACNGCGNVTPEDDMRKVTLAEATLPGPHAEVGLRSDVVTEGELCGSCRERVRKFVGEDGAGEAILPDEALEPVTA